MANLKINRGTTYTIAGTVKINGVAQSLVGSTVRFTAKTTEFTDTWTDTDAVIIKNITTGNALGEYNIILTPADTSHLEPGKYYYDIKVDLASNGVTVYKLDEGTIKLDGSPTNRLS